MKEETSLEGKRIHIEARQYKCSLQMEKYKPSSKTIRKELSNPSPKSCVLREPYYE